MSASLGHQQLVRYLVHTLILARSTKGCESLELFGGSRGNRGNFEIICDFGIPWDLECLKPVMYSLVNDRLHYLVSLGFGRATNRAFKKSYFMNEWMTTIYICRRNKEHWELCAILRLIFPPFCNRGFPVCFSRFPRGNLAPHRVFVWTLAWNHNWALT